MTSARARAEHGSSGSITVCARVFWEKAWPVTSKEGLPHSSRRRREAHMRIQTKTITLLLVLVALVAMTSTAFAQAGASGYKTNGENLAGTVQGAEQGGGGAGGDVAGQTAVADQGGSLPFTGLDVALILAVGGVLLAVG